jgi:hemolysin III
MRWPPKEPFNSYSHFAGALLSVVGLVVLVFKSGEDWWDVAGFAVYGASLILLYSASTLYHSLHVSARTEDWLRRFDNMAIFLLIAGTYTPVCLSVLRDSWGLHVLALIWSIAAAGIGLKLFFAHLPAWLTAVVYLGMGWLGVLVIGPLVHVLPLEGLAWLIGGGVLYTVGAIIYALERPDPYPAVFGHHEIFHCFVLGGSVLHFVFVAGYVAAGV